MLLIMSRRSPNNNRRFYVPSKNCYIINLLIFFTCFVNHVLGSESTLDNSVLHERLMFSSELTLGPYHIIADVTKGQYDKTASERITKAFSAFESTLNAQIESGNYPDHWPDRINSLKGSSKTEYIESRKQRDLANMLELFENRYVNREDGFTVDCHSNSPQEVKKTIEYKYKIVNGEKRERSRVEVRAFNPNYSAIYLPLSKYGSVDAGVIDDPGLAVTYGEQPFAKAGTPYLHGWAANDIVSVMKIKSEKDSILRVVYNKRLNTKVNKTLIFEVLSEKGYKLKDSYVFNNGNLVQRWKFADYRKLPDGSLYPYQQDYTLYYKTDLAELRNAINQQDWSAVDSIPDNIEAQRVKYNSYKIQNAEKTEEIPVNEFDLVFAPGTTVVNTRYKKDIRMITNQDILASTIAMESKPEYSLPSGVTIEETEPEKVKLEQLIDESIQKLNTTSDVNMPISKTTIQPENQTTQLSPSHHNKKQISTKPASISNFNKTFYIACFLILAVLLIISVFVYIRRAR